MALKIAKFNSVVGRDSSLIYRYLDEKFKTFFWIECGLRILFNPFKGYFKKNRRNYLRSRFFCKTLLKWYYANFS